MFVDVAGRLGDGHRERVPAAFRGVLGIEVVLAVLAGTAPVLDDVLLVVADDDGEVAVLLDPALGDGLDGPHPPIAVGPDDPFRDGAGELAGLLEVRSPGIDRVCHTRPWEGRG